MKASMPAGQNRRQFLQHAAIATASFAAGSALGQAEPKPAKEKSKAKPLVGSQLFGWGQYEQRMGKQLADHLDEVLQAIHDAGYAYAEGTLDISKPDNNAQFAEQLGKHRLQPVSLYTGGTFHEKSAANETVSRITQAARVAGQAGFTIINCNPDHGDHEKTEAELETQAAALNRLGRELKNLGIRLGIHNHTPAMQNEAREFHHNFQHTDPSLVGFCFDVHWVYRGGLAPLTAFRELADRIVSWHLRQSRNHTWWQELDTGDIDYAALAEAMHQKHLTAPLTVELAIEEGTEITRSAIENHRRSREFVRRIFGA